MKDKSQVEAALERSLRKQVTVPRLDRKFDAGVWARIEAESTRAATPAVQKPTSSAMTARWLNIINIAGVVSVALFLYFFGWQSLSGMNIGESLTEISAATRENILQNIMWIVSTLAVAFGLMYTPLGRRVREELG
jgi:hypothetical protein